MRHLFTLLSFFLLAQHLTANDDPTYQLNTMDIPLTTKTIRSLYTRITLDDIPLQAPTFYLEEHPLKDAFYFSTLKEEKQAAYYPWYQEVNLSLPITQEFTGSSATLTSQSQQVNQLQVTHATDNFAFQGRYLHDDGYKDHTNRDLINIALQKHHRTEKFTIEHFLLLNSIQQNDMTYVVGKNAFHVEDLKKSNPIDHATNNASQLFYFADIRHDVDTEKTLLLKPYLRFNQTRTLLDEAPSLSNDTASHPQEKTQAGSVGIHTLFSKPYSDHSDITTAFRFDYTYGDYLQRQNEDSGLLNYPTGKHYDFTVETLSFNWQMKIEQQLGDIFSVIYDINVDKTHYFYRNALPAGSVCTNLTDTCMYQSPDQPNLNFFTWTPLIGLNVDINKDNQAQLHFYHDMQQPNSLDLYLLQQTQNIKSIKPQITNATELTIVGDLSRVIHYEWTLYYRTIDHLILADENGVNSFKQKVRSLGLDSLTQMKLSNKLKFTLGFSMTDSQYVNNNNSLAAPSADNQVKLIPRTQGFAAIDWRLLERSTLKIVLTHTGKYYLDNDNTQSYNGHELLDVYWQQQFNQGWQITAAVNNITNQDYAWIAGTTRATENTPTYIEKYVIGNPRYLSVSISKHF